MVGFLRRAKPNFGGNCCSLSAARRQILSSYYDMGGREIQTLFWFAAWSSGTAHAALDVVRGDRHKLNPAMIFV
jgi:hypothetical protein